MHALVKRSLQRLQSCTFGAGQVFASHHAAASFTSLETLGALSTRLASGSSVKLRAARQNTLSPPRRGLASSASSSTGNVSGKPNQTPYYITTPIFYVNAEPHLGHLYSAVMADVAARWQRNQNRVVHFMTGTDEHGSKVEEASRKNGYTSPKEFCDNISGKFKNTWQDFNIMFDDYARTTAYDHIENVQRVWRKLKEADMIYLGQHSGWYCRSDEAFVPESQLIPYTLDGKEIRIMREGEELTSPKASETGKTNMVNIPQAEFQRMKERGEVRFTTASGHSVEWISEDNYKFRLSRMREPLLKWLRSQPAVVEPPHRLQEVISAVEAGIDDFSVSRLADKMPWGIDVPDDPSHKIYVWLDALNIYLTSAWRFQKRIQEGSSAASEQHSSLSQVSSVQKASTANSMPYVVETEASSTRAALFDTNNPNAQQDAAQLFGKVPHPHLVQGILLPDFYQPSPSQLTPQGYAQARVAFQSEINETPQLQHQLAHFHARRRKFDTQMRKSTFQFPGPIDVAGANALYPSPAWPAADQIIGQDILKFHAIYWPALLMAAGVPPPKRVISHGHWLCDGRKMSKSLGNVIAPHILKQLGVDEVRYVLIKSGELGSDKNLTPAEAFAVINSDLSDVFGNLAMRCTGKALLPDQLHPMTPADVHEMLTECGRVHAEAVREFEALKRRSEATSDQESKPTQPSTVQLPAPGTYGVVTPLEVDLQRVINTAIERAVQEYEMMNLDAVPEIVMGMLRATNAYFACCQPWTLKTDSNSSEIPDLAEWIGKRRRVVLYHAIEAVRAAAILLYPIIPTASETVLRGVGYIPQTASGPLHHYLSAEAARFGWAPEVPTPVGVSKPFRKVALEDVQAVCAGKILEEGGSEAGAKTTSVKKAFALSPEEQALRKQANEERRRQKAEKKEENRRKRLAEAAASVGASDQPS